MNRNNFEMPPGVVTTGNLLDVLQGFVHELRAAGLPVSMTENLDAMRAVEYISMEDRESFKAVLAATLVKHHQHWPAFDTVFEVYFARWSPGVDGDEGSESSSDDRESPEGGGAGKQPGGGGGGEGVSNEDLAKMLMQALMKSDDEMLRNIAAMAVSRFAGMEPGRPVGGTYYLYRTLRQLDLDGVAEKMMSTSRESRDVPDDALAERLASDDHKTKIKKFKEMVEEEIRRRLIADRGVEAMARTLRKPLPEDVEFMHASREEMLQLQRAIEPLTRALAARLAQRRKRRRRGQLDFRRTVRHSLSYGGVPLEPKFRNPRPSKPEIMVIADISGSVASFARFTLQFVYAMAGQFSKVRSWVFIDGIDEVTRFFEESDEITEAVQRVNSEADVIWVDGHSDYGHAFEIFGQRHMSEITKKTTVIILGDARNNYHATQATVLKEIRERSRKLFWLNPEPRGYWNTGDSVVGDYGIYCDGVFECRNLRQLETFVSSSFEV